MEKKYLTRRDFLRLSGMVIGGVALTRCAPVATQTPPPAIEEATQPPASPSTVTLEVNGWKYQAGRDSQKLVFEALERDLQGIKLEVTGASTSDWYVQIKSRFQSGDVPDVVLMEPGAGLREYSPLLLPLDDYIAKTPEVQEDKYFPSAWKEAQVGGKVMGLPGFLGVQSPWYNATIFEKLGVEKPPANYDELKEVAKACRDGGFLPFLVGGKDGWHRLDAIQHVIHSFAPGKLYEAEAGSLSFNDPDFVAAFEVWGEMFANGVFQDGAIGMSAYPDCWDLFVQGKAGMINMGSWATSELLPGLTEGITDRYMPMFFPDLSGSGKKVATSGVDQLYCIPKDAGLPDESWKVIAWMTQNDIKYTNDSGALPSRLEGVWPDILSNAQDQNQLEEIKKFYMDALNIATRRQLIYPELRSGLEEVSAAVASGQMTAQQAVEKLDEVSQGIERS